MRIEENQQLPSSGPSIHMYSLYVSTSMLVVSFDVASSNRESVIQYAI